MNWFKAKVWPHLKAAGLTMFWATFWVGTIVIIVMAVVKHRPDSQSSQLSYNLEKIDQKIGEVEKKIAEARVAQATPLPMPAPKPVEPPKAAEPTPTPSALTAQKIPITPEHSLFPSDGLEEEVEGFMEKMNKDPVDLLKGKSNRVKGRSASLSGMVNTNQVTEDLPQSDLVKRKLAAALERENGASNIKTTSIPRVRYMIFNVVKRNFEGIATKSFAEWKDGQEPMPTPTWLRETNLDILSVLNDGREVSEAVYHEEGKRNLAREAGIQQKLGEDKAHREQIVRNVNRSRFDLDRHSNTGWSSRRRY